MAEEKDIRYAHRICPCLPNDVEGIQTWLEDLAAEGLLLEPDGAFLGIYSFRRTQPRHVRYRMAPMKRKKGFFQENGDGPDLEEEEFSLQCGWEYLMRCGSFYIYRATDPNARPLHTDPAVHAMALNAVRKQHRNSMILEILYLALIFALRGFGFSGLYLSAALTGPLHAAALLGLLGWALIRLTADAVRLSRYYKRLRGGDTLERPKNWKRHAWQVCIWKQLPTVLVLVLLITLGISLKRADASVALEDFGSDPPFATMQDVFPGSEADYTTGLGDYNTALHYSTALSDNYEWKELVYITADGVKRHCILRLQYHELAAPWLARGVAEDYYRQEAFRYRGKRFEELTAPETRLDSVRVFSSYGILHIVICHGSRVVHAVVTIDGPEQTNQWHLWLEAMEATLLAQ